jgi:hypothetical protein
LPCIEVNNLKGGNMNMRDGQRIMLLSMLVALTILSMNCRLAARLVATATPAAIPTPAYTATPGSPPTTAPMSGPFRLVIPVGEVLPGTFEALVSNGDGALWLVTGEGIARLVDTTWTVYLAGFTGKIAGIDATGRVWVVSEDAARISAWNGREWTAYGVEAGWAPLTDDFYAYVRGGQSDSQGRVWFATSQDVRAFDGNRWTVYTPQEMGMGSSAYDDARTGFEVTILSSGIVWVSECDWGGPGPFGGRGIRWFDQGAWQGAASPVASGCATAVAADSLGRVWAGVESSLWRYDPVSGDWTEFAPPESPIVGMQFGFIDSLAVDPQGAAWPVLALCGGASCFARSVLYHFHDGLWAQAGEVGELTAGYWGPVFDSAGVPWLSWDGGIYRIGGDSPELVSPLAGRSGVMDRSGRLWFVASYEGRDTLWVLDAGTRN